MAAFSTQTRAEESCRQSGAQAARKQGEKSSLLDSYIVCKKGVKYPAASYGAFVKITQI